MCDIFPEVENCCFIISLRVGMLFISVIAVVTGGLMLSLCEQRINASFQDVKNVTEIRDVQVALSKSAKIIASAISAMSVVFMTTGVILLFATLADEEGFVQVFVWVTFANLIFAFVTLLLLCYDCTFHEECIMSDLDWLSGAIIIVLLVAYLLVWFHFIAVSNSYVLQV